MRTIERRLAELERHVASGEQEATGELWTQEEWQARLCSAFVHNELHFDRPGHASIHPVGASALAHDFLRDMAEWVNNLFVEQPGTILCPLMPIQVEMGLRVLDAGLIDQHLRGMPGASALDGYCYVFGERFDLHGLVYALRAALKVVNAQVEAKLETSLEGLRQILVWQKVEE